MDFSFAPTKQKTLAEALAEAQKPRPYDMPPEALVQALTSQPKTGFWDASQMDPAELQRMGGAATPLDPDKAGAVKQAFLTDNGIRSMWTGQNPDAPKWANDLGEGLNTALMAAPHFGIFAGPKALTADLGALKRAETMAAGGAYPSDIWEETGWGKGADSKWRFEIPDNKAWAIGDTLDTDSLAPLSQNVRHDALYAAYPDMADMQSVLSGHGGNGAYGPVEGKETIYASGELPSDQTSTALHEMQHAVQAREGFARGGNPSGKALKDVASSLAEQAGPRYDALVGDMHSYQDEWAAKRGLKRLDDGYTSAMMAASKEWRKTFPDKAEALDIAAKEMMGIGGMGVYKRLAGEVEARNVSKRMAMTAEERRAMPPDFTEDVPRSLQVVLGQR